MLLSNETMNEQVFEALTSLIVASDTEFHLKNNNETKRKGRVQLQIRTHSMGMFHYNKVNIENV